MIREEKVTLENVSRRNFLQGLISTGALVLCVGKSPLLAKSARNGVLGALGSIDASAFHPGIFVGIHTDGTVYIVAHRTEMGNGVRTSLPRVLAEGYCGTPSTV